MAERSRRIDSTHREFQRLWELVHMICWAYNPHLFLHSSNESDGSNQRKALELSAEGPEGESESSNLFSKKIESWSLELDLADPERLALIEILKAEMARLLEEMRSSGDSELADEVNAILKDGPFDEAVNGLRIVLTDFDFIPTPPVSEEEARARDAAHPDITTLRELVGDLKLSHWRWIR